MSQFDLTNVMSPFLDVQLVLPMMGFFSQNELYNRQDLLQAKLGILNKTNMIDFYIEIRGELYPDEEVPEFLKKKRITVISEIQELEEVVGPLVRVIKDAPETLKDRESLIAYLVQEINFDIKMMEDIYRIAKLRYECGGYSKAKDYLYIYLSVMTPTDENYLNALWGKLAAEILLREWKTALEHLNILREFIDSQSFSSPMHLLQQRAWLIHWSLFIYFNYEPARDLIIDMFLYRQTYLNTIQTLCPHILRYLAAVVIINRSRKSALKDLIKVIQQESYNYKDPITEFLKCLYVNFDFEGARQKLQECVMVFDYDFFLVSLFGKFVDNARILIFETFCRIHQCISIQMLAEKLNMDPESAECWIVELIRDARLDAKIDSKLGHVVMGTQPTSPFQQILEKVDSLATRSEALQALIDRKLKAKSQEGRW